MEEPNITPSFTGDIPTVEEEIISNCVIHFRPKSNWDGSKYGFDWVRIGDSGMDADKHSINHHYANLMGKYYGFGKIDTTVNIGPKPSVIKTERFGVCDDPNSWEKTTLGHPATFRHEIALYRDFVSRYFPKRLIISWKKGLPSICPSGMDNDIKTEIDKTQFTYFVPVMTLIQDKTANLKMRCELNPSDPPPTKIEIFEKLEVGEEPCFEFLNGTEKKDNPENNKKYDLDIKCIDTFSEDKLIEAYATYPDGSKKLCGQLRVLANNEVLKFCVLFIKVGLKVDGSWERANLSNAEKTQMENIFNQAMIEVISPPTVEFDITPTTPPAGIDSRITNLLESHSGSDKFFPKRNGISDRAGGMINGAFEGHLRNIGQYERFSNYMFIHNVNIKAQNPLPDNKFDQTNGFTAVSSGVIVLFLGHEAETLPHEMMHVVGLPHTYTGKETESNAEYTWKARTTDNILDYSHQLTPAISRVTTWQWQWQKARSFVRRQTRKENNRVMKESMEKLKATMKQNMPNIKSQL